MSEKLRKKRLRSRSKKLKTPPTTTIQSAKVETKKKLKLKSRVTKEYEQNEKDVENLSQNRYFLQFPASERKKYVNDDDDDDISDDYVDDNADDIGGFEYIDDNSKNTQFFLATSETEILNFGNEKLGKSSTPHSGENPDFVVNSDSELSTDISNIVRGSSSSTDQIRSTGANGKELLLTAASFLQIDTETLTHIQRPVKHQINAQLLYQPNESLNFNMRMNMKAKSNQKTDENEEEQESGKKLTANQIRMLNRFIDAAKAEDKKISKKLLTVISSSVGNKFFMTSDKSLLYHKVCNYKFRSIFFEPSPEIVEIPNRKFLKIYIKELRFTQHPQIIDEHRLANAVEDNYNEYSAQIKLRVCENLYGKLQTERSIVNKLLSCADEDANEIQDSKYLENLTQHLLNVKTLRNKYYDESAKNKKLLKEILDNWLKLKNVRKQQKFQYTRFKLRLRVFDEKADDYNKGTNSNWEENFEIDLNEIYREELELYYCAKRLWKQQQYENEYQSASDIITIKPEKPNVTQLTQELKDRYKKCFYRPVEPRVDIIRDIVRDEEFFVVPASNQHNLKSFFMKIYFDEQFVGETRSYRMEPDLRLVIKEAIGIFLERRLPKSIRITIYEKSKLSTPRKISTINVPLRIESATSNDYQTEKLEFVSIKPPHMAGYVTLCIQCDEQLYSSNMDLNTLYAPVKSLDTETLNTNATTAELMKSASKESSSESDNKNDDKTTKNSKTVKTCTFEETLLQFCSFEKIENNQRFKLLTSRYLQNDLRTKNLHFIPILEHELEILYDEPEEPVIEAGNWMNPIDLHKHEGKKHIKIIYEIISNKCNHLNKTMATTESLLVGDTPDSWSAFFQALAIFSPGRTLTFANNNDNPRKPSFQQTLTFEKEQHFKICINIVRATGIPVRNTTISDNDSKQRSSTGSSQLFMAPNFNYTNVRPFVTLSYREKLCRTLTAEGSSPTWNEQLVLHLSGSLKDFKDDIKISLFDEVIESYYNDDTVGRGADIYQRIQTNWLGEYRLPITTVLTKQKLEGVFEMNTPKVLIGYKPNSLDNQLTINNSETNILIEQYPEFKESVRIWFYINIEPTFDLPTINTKCMDCSELKEVRQSLQNWCINVKELKPELFIDPLVCASNGRRVCITRLLEPIPLPIETSENLLDTVCRFTGLISILKTYDACTAWQGVWLNNEALLDTTWGSAKDIGVLLCNLLLALGVHCSLVLGTALPYGDSAFILFKAEDGDLMLIDPCTGKRYYTKDIFCPLSKINYIVAQDNIYANIQLEKRVSMTNFKLNDTACWLPAFSKSNPAPLGGVQNLNYSYMSSFNILELRQNIERKIIKKITSWRTMRKTIWNRAFNYRLLTILQELEQITTFLSGSYLDTKYNEQLIQEFPNYKLYGFTLNFAYVNLAGISERIKSTGFHLNSNKNVEFSCAVYINEYPNDILSVWIFLLSITPI